MTVFVKPFAWFLLALMANRIKALFCTISQELDPTYRNTYRWVIPVKDPCQCTVVQVGGINSHAPYRPFDVMYYDTFLYSNDPVEIRKWLRCPDILCLEDASLGMEDGRIGGSSITASSTYNDNIESFGPPHARLNHEGEAGSWCPKNDDMKPWIQVDFDPEVSITGLITQGRSHDAYSQWVTKYQVKYSPDGANWYNVTRADGRTAEFAGNVDKNSPVTTRFNATLCTRFLRIVPTAWEQRCRMRFEVLGCYY